MNPIDADTWAAGYLIFSIVVFATAAAISRTRSTFFDRQPLASIAALVAVNAAAALAAAFLLGPAPQLLITIIAGFALTFAASRLLKGFSFNGALLMTSQVQFYLAGLLWGASVVAAAKVDPLTRALLVVGFSLSCLYIIIALVQHLEQLDVIFRHDVLWPSIQANIAARARYPKVSLHVPVYAEPPNLVIGTLNALAALDYPNYEVLVIDNNTADPLLWRPVELHCGRLGERFHFLHVDQLAGAKAGALNFALRHVASDTELIGVVDSDYRVVNNYVSSLVAYFDNPTIGFVQTPHAYRDWQSCGYLRICNWEYSMYLVSTLVSRNERKAGITLGTMGLIRRKALEEVGGWAEWCLTEDSELALRIHAAGYKSVYINAVLGRGLIPDTFRGYKRQRFRWRYGSIQELRRHFRLFLPAPLAEPSSLTTLQKLSHVMHGMDTMKSVGEILLLAMATLVAASMLLHSDTIAFPRFVWPILVAATILVTSSKVQVFWMLGWSLRDLISGLIARAALDHTFAVAGISALLTQGTAWRRTNKFPAVPTRLAAFSAVLPELSLGTVTLAASIAMLRADSSMGLLALLSCCGIIKSAKYLFAPFLSVLAELCIRQRAAHEDIAQSADDALSAPGN